VVGMKKWMPTQNRQKSNVKSMKASKSEVIGRCGGDEKLNAKAMKA